jgi:hypothetical protein
MSDAFDPYWEWLQLADLGAPLDHYRLLGIRPFEDNPQVIQHACMLRVAELLRHERDPQGHRVPAICEQVEDAAACLIDPRRRREYEQQLLGASESDHDAQTASSQSSVAEPDSLPREPTSIGPDPDPTIPQDSQTGETAKARSDPSWLTLPDASAADPAESSQDSPPACSRHAPQDDIDRSRWLDPPSRAARRGASSNSGPSPDAKSPPAKRAAATNKHRPAASPPAGRGLDAEPRTSRAAARAMRRAGRSSGRWWAIPENLLPKLLILGLCFACLVAMLAWRWSQPDEHDEAVAAYVAQLSSQDALRRFDAVKSLRNLGLTDRSSEELLRLLERDPSVSVRLAAAEALANDPRAAAQHQARLRAILAKETNPDVRSLLRLAVRE